jgi:hypothetical protein
MKWNRMDPEQPRTASRLSSLGTLITAQAKKLDTLKFLKQGLMQGLFPSPERSATLALSEPSQVFVGGQH